MGIFYLLLAKLAGIVKVVAVKKCGNVASGEKNSVKINLIRSVGCLLVSIAVFLFSSGYLDETGFWVSALSGVSNAAFLFLWILAAERVSLCLVELFCMLGSVAIPLFLAPVLYAGEQVLWYQWLCVGMLFVSTFLFFPDAKESTKLDGKALLLLLGCALGSAGAAITQKLYVAYSAGTIAGFNLVTFAVTTLCFGVIFALISAKKAPADQVDEKTENVENKPFSASVGGLIALATVMLYANQFLSTQAANHFVSAVFYPLSYAIGWPLTILADICIFKEKPTAKKWIGLAITIAASILISL